MDCGWTIYIYICIYIYIYIYIFCVCTYVYIYMYIANDGFGVWRFCFGVYLGLGTWGVRVLG